MENQKENTVEAGLIQALRLIFNGDGIVLNRKTIFSLWLWYSINVLYTNDVTFGECTLYASFPK